MYHRDLLGRDTTGTRLDRLQGRVTAVTFSPDGRFALAASAKDQGSDDGVCIWDVETRRLIRYWRAHSAGTFSAAFSSDGNLILTGGGCTWQGHGTQACDGTLRLWNAATGEMLREIRDLCLDVCQRAVAVSPDGSFAVGGSAAVPFDENLSVWDVASGKLSKRLGKYGPVRSVALSADGHRLLVVAAATGSGAESRCELWDTRRWTVEPVAEPDDGYGLLLSAAFAPDGSVLVGTLNNVYRCQIGPDRAAVPLLRPLLQGCFHMDSSGHRIATGHGGRDEPGAPYEDCCARVWDVDSRTQTAEMPTRFPVETIAISPDGEHVITGGEWGEVHLWSIRAARTRGWPWRPW